MQELSRVFDGWNGYNTSIIHAVEPLTAAQLEFRPAVGLRSVGEVVRHIAVGRLSWFMRMAAPGSAELAQQVPLWHTDGDGNRDPLEESVEISASAAGLVRWLGLSWSMVEQTLAAWTVADLEKVYRHVYYHQAYAVSYQWTLFRILAHDLHHGGELSLLLGLQGIEAGELSALGGHIIEPPLLDDV
jgi:uncharacterized damage-inducible protein DinB